MTFDYGTTRFVFCVGGVAIKIARIHPVRWMFRFFYWKKRGGVTKKLSTIATSRVKAILMVIAGGIIGNIEEYWFSHQHPELPIARTIFSFFGLVNIQVRGKPIKEEELPLCPFREYAHLEYDLRRIEHFGWINGRGCLLDYGTHHVNVLLAELEECRHAYR